jgi:hypothetical protein
MFKLLKNQMRAITLVAFIAIIAVVFAQTKAAKPVVAL